MRTFLIGLAAVATLPLMAAGADPIKVRHAGFRELGSAMKNMGDMLRSGTVQPMIMQNSVKTITKSSKEIYKWFPAGSGPKPGVKTEAKAEIWTKKAEFKAKQDAFAKQAGEFAKLATSTDPAAIGAGMKALGATCGGCHRQFKVEDHDHH